MTAGAGARGVPGYSCFLVVADLFNLDPQRDPLIGRTLDGRYEVLGRLGSGGMGVVYRGRQAHLERFVAIKVLHRDTAAIPEWRQRFEREARALSALAHPNVVPVTDSGFDGGVPFLVMELLEGKTLAELIKEGPLPLGRALDIGRQILRGLAFAHGKGIIHRDLKPTNVFLQALPDQADHVRLLDFGTAKFLEGSGSPTLAETLTRVGVVFGTPAYMSPEQAKAAPVDARTDVYAAGVLLFELLAGRRPYVAESQDGYIAAHLSQPVPSLAKVRPGIVAAPAFQAVIERAMAKDPAARFKDAAALLAALEEVIAKLPAAAMMAGPGGPARGRGWRRVAVVVGAVAVAAGAGAIYVSRSVKRHGELAGPSASPAAGTGAPLEAPSRVEPQPAVAPPPAVAPSPAPAPPPAAAPSEVAPSAAASLASSGDHPAPPPSPSAPAPSTGETAALPAPSAPPEEPSLAAAPPAEAGPGAPATPPAAKASPPAEISPAAPPPPPPVAAREPATAPARRERPPEGGARDPWRDPVPRALRSIHGRVERGAHLSQRSLRPAYTYAHQNPSDPRPWLLLGHAYAQLDWLTDSVERYVHAHQIDSASRGDPQMLPDLLKAAAHPAAGSVGARAIRDIYGTEALPALQKAIDAATRSGDRDDAARLVRLRDSLGGR
ncbi:MAG TPA: protein kinase [Polyangia bacterium]